MDNGIVYRPKPIGYIETLFHNITVFTDFIQINAALVSTRDFFQKHKKMYDPK